MWVWEDELGEQMCEEWEVCGEWVWEDESMTLMVQWGGEPGNLNKAML